MKDYLLFAGHRYYPNGGFNDYKMRGTIEECKEYFKKEYKKISNNSYIDNWAQIVDSETLKVVETGEMDFSGTVPNEPIWIKGNKEFEEWKKFVEEDR